MPDTGTKSEHFLLQLAEAGYERDRLEDMRRLIDASDSGLCDVLACVLFTNEPKTRTERAGAVSLEDGTLAQGE